MSVSALLNLHATGSSILLASMRLGEKCMRSRLPFRISIAFEKEPMDRPTAGRLNLVPVLPR